MTASESTSTAQELRSVAQQQERSPRIVVLRHVQRLLREGVVRPSEPLPSERNLAEQLQVTRLTVRRALAILEEQGLIQRRPNGKRVARDNVSLARTAVGTTFAVTMPDVADDPRFGQRTQTGWPEVMGQSAIHALRQARRSVMIISPYTDWQTTLAQLRAAPPAGIIVAETPGSEDVLDDLTDPAALPCPIVAYSDHPRWRATDRVVSDHRHGALTQYRFLRERGRRRILTILPPSDNQKDYWINQRIAGYDEARAEFGDPYRCIVTIPGGRGRPWEAEGFEADVRLVLGYLAEYLSGPDRADAIMCPSDGSVFHAAAACQKLALEPGRDVDIVGYDNYWRDASESKFVDYQPLATLDKRNDLIGAEMVKLLLERIDGKLDSEPQVRHVEPKLVIPS